MPDSSTIIDSSVPVREHRLVLVPLIIACALLMENLDGTVIATALPNVARELGEPVLHLSLAITGYLLSLSVFIPISGWMADRFGARRVFRTAILVFTASSLLCAAAHSLTQLVAARMVQGMGGAMMVPVGRLLLLREVPKRELVAAMSYMTIPALLGPVLGPPLGGFITTYASWRWIFVINLPIGVLGFWLVTRFIAEVREPAPRPLDFPGWLLCGAGLAGLIFGFENLGRGLLPSPLLWVMIGGGIVALFLYRFHARRRDNPIIDLGLLRIPTFAASVQGGSIYRIATGSMTLLLPLMLQLGFGLSALESGLTTFASAGGSLLMKFTAPRILRRVGFRRVLMVNTLVAAAFTCGYGQFQPEMPRWAMVGVLLVGGFFSSLQFTCFNTMVFADIPESRMSQATSFSSTAQQLSLSLGVGLASQFLAVLMRLRTESTPLPQDFAIAFAVFALVGASAVLWFRCLPRDAGEALSGHAASVPAPGT